MARHRFLLGLSLSLLATAVIAAAPLRAQPLPGSGTGEGIACYGAETKSGWSVKQTGYYESVAGDRRYQFEGECTYYYGSVEPAVKVKVNASWDAATKTAKENVTVLKYHSTDVPGSILFNVKCDADPWIDPLNAFIHGQHVVCHGGVWNNDTAYNFTLDPSGFPTFGYPLTRGLGWRVPPEFPAGQGQPASNQPQTTAPVIASPAAGETVDTKFLLLVKHPQYTGQKPVAYSSAILQAEASTSSGWQPVPLTLPRILDFASVKLDIPTAVTLRPGQYRVRAQPTITQRNAVYGGDWTGWRLFKVEPLASTLNGLYEAAGGGAPPAGRPQNTRQPNAPGDNQAPASVRLIAARSTGPGSIEVSVANRTKAARDVPIEIQHGSTVVGRARVHLAANGQRCLVVRWNPPPGTSGTVQLAVFIAGKQSGIVQASVQ